MEWVMGQGPLKISGFKIEWGTLGDFRFRKSDIPELPLFPMENPATPLDVSVTFVRALLSVPLFRSATTAVFIFQLIHVSSRKVILAIPCI